MLSIRHGFVGTAPRLCSHNLDRARGMFRVARGASFIDALAGRGARITRRTGVTLVTGRAGVTRCASAARCTGVGRDFLG